VPSLLIAPWVVIYVVSMFVLVMVVVGAIVTPLVLIFATLLQVVRATSPKNDASLVAMVLAKYQEMILLIALHHVPNVLTGPNLAAAKNLESAGHLVLM